MSYIGSVTYSGVPPQSDRTSNAAKAVRRPRASAGVEWPADRADFTGPTVRGPATVADEARVALIRQQIATGTYLTRDKLDVVIDQLSEMLRQQTDTTRASA